MTWLNLETNFNRKPEFLGASLSHRGAWISMIVWAASIENGGKVAGASRWPAQMWEQTCGVQAKIIAQECSLWWFEGDDLIIWGYPKAKENQVIEGRKQGEHGSKGGRPKNPYPKPLPETPTETPKGREGKGIGKEGNGTGGEGFSVEGQIQRIVDLYSVIRADAPMESLAAVVRSVAKGARADEILAATKLCVEYQVEMGGGGNAYSSSRRKFFEAEMWREPRDFEARLARFREARQAGEKKEKGAAGDEPFLPPADKLWAPDGWQAVFEEEWNHPAIPWRDLDKTVQRQIIELVAKKQKAES